MNPEGLFTPMKSGKKVLSPKDMAAQSGWTEGHVDKCIDVGYLNPPHYTSKYAIDGVQLSPGDEGRLADHERVLKDKTKGKFSDKNIHDAAIGMLVEEKRKGGQPVFYKFKEKSAEEVFKQFLESPAGHKRLGKNGIALGEINNIHRGGQWFDNPANQTAMPNNYDQVLWETKKQKAAELQVLAEMGDKDAAEKYNRIRNALADSSLLPELNLGGKKETAREKILRD